MARKSNKTSTSTATVSAINANLSAVKEAEASATIISNLNAAMESVTTAKPKKTTASEATQTTFDRVSVWTKAYLEAHEDSHLRPHDNLPTCQEVCLTKQRGTGISMYSLPDKVKVILPVALIPEDKRPEGAKIVGKGKGLRVYLGLDDLETALDTLFATVTLSK